MDREKQEVDIYGAKMLKLKDNVDLKELERFGFRKSDSCFKYEYDYTILTIVDYQILIYKDRTIKVTQSSMYQVDNRLLDTLYDLIQAGLVEKVEE